jgi:sugar lactone lactonase YvrE
MLLRFSGGSLFNLETLAVDNAGNIWVANNQSVTELSNTGVVLSGSSGYTSGSLYHPSSIAIDESGNAWVANSSYNAVGEVSSTGSILSGSAGYVLTSLYASGVAIAIDGSGDAWIGTIGNGAKIFELSSTGSNLSGANGYSGTTVYDGDCIAIDVLDNVWVTGNSVVKLSSAGAILSGANGFSGGGGCIAIDHAGNVWVPNAGTEVVELSSTGAVLSGANGYAGGGLNNPSGVAIDGAGDVWVTNNPQYPYYTGSMVVEISSTGTFLSGPNGYVPGGSSLSYSRYVAIDGSGNVWIPEAQSLVELVGAATPVVTPLAVGVKNNMLGTRP